MNIKVLKSIYYRKESETNEAYDKTAAFIKLMVSEETPEARKEKIEISQISSSRELSALSYTGRKKGSLKLVKSMSKALLTTHSDLIKAGLGDLTTAGSPIAVTGVTNTVITASSTGYVAGDIIQITADNIQLQHLLVVESDASTVTVRNELTDEEVAIITAATTKTVKKLSKCKIGSPLQGSTFTVVREYGDGEIEVARGCGVAINFEIVTTGEAKVNIDFMAAHFDYKDEYNQPYEMITGSITTETNQTPVLFDFKSSILRDIDNTVDKVLFPQSLALKTSHTLIENDLIGGLNNVVGFYIQPKVDCEANFHYSSTNRLLFDDSHETDSTQFYFTGQSNFSFYAPSCFFIGQNPADHNVYDSINVLMNINSHETLEPVICLPQ